MAANVEWILQTEPRGTKVVVWAHNAHVQHDRLDGALETMGSNLARALGKSYLALGFVFNRGSFQAIDHRPRTTSPALAEFELGAAPADYVGAAFARVGLPLFAVDLRRRPQSGPVRRWFDAVHPMRNLGAVFTTDEESAFPSHIGAEFDAVLFVDRTTRARKLTPATLPDKEGKTSE